MNFVVESTRNVFQGIEDRVRGRAEFATDFAVMLAVCTLEASQQLSQERQLRNGDGMRQTPFFEQSPHVCSYCGLKQMRRSHWMRANAGLTLNKERPR